MENNKNNDYKLVTSTESVGKKANAYAKILFACAYNAAVTFGGGYGVYNFAKNIYENFDSNEIMSLQNLSNLWLNGVPTAVFAALAIKGGINVVKLAGVTLVSGMEAGIGAVDSISDLKNKFSRK